MTFLSEMSVFPVWVPVRTRLDEADSSDLPRSRFGNDDSFWVLEDVSKTGICQNRDFVEPVQYSGAGAVEEDPDPYHGDPPGIAPCPTTPYPGYHPTTPGTTSRPVARAEHQSGVHQASLDTVRSQQTWLPAVPGFSDSH